MLSSMLAAAAADYELIDSYPHYSGGFTQGLVLHNKQLLS